MSEETYVSFDDDNFDPGYDAQEKVDVDEPECNKEVTE